MLELRSVSRSTGRETILERATLAFARDAPTTVLGLSPTGRKAFLRLLSGADRPQAGSIRLDGRELGRSLRADRDFTWISRGGVPSSSRSVGQMLTASAGRRAGDAGIASLADRVRLGGKLDAKVRDLDLDQRLRLAIACARGGRPTLILLEAPFVDLGHELRMRLLADVAGMLTEAGAVVVLAAATPDEATAMGGTTVILANGRVVQAGPTDEVFAHPRDLRAAVATSHPLLNTLVMTLADGICRLTDGATFAAPQELGLPQAGRCTLAFRPDDLHLARRSDHALRFVVRAAGEETVVGRRYARVTFADATWLAPQTGAASSSGMVLNGFVDRDCLMVFDEQGLSIRAGNAQTPG
jgi:glycerol transport system ATP-binding protein